MLHMTNLRFEPQMPWVIRILLKAGLQNQRQAEVVLSLFVVFCVLFTVWMITSQKERPPQNDVQQNPNYEPMKSR